MPPVSFNGFGMAVWLTLIIGLMELIRLLFTKSWLDCSLPSQSALSLHSIQPSSTDTKYVLLKANGPRNSNLTFLAEANFVGNAQRVADVNFAIQVTAEANPSAHFVLVTSISDIFISQPKLFDGFDKLSYEVFYTHEVLYSTLFDLGNRYPGLKVAGSADDMYPPMDFQCKMKDPLAIYGMSRKEIKKLSGEMYSCETKMEVGSFDSVLFQHIPDKALTHMRYSRSYLGAENVAAWIFANHSFEFHNLCPWYAPIHVHRTDNNPRGFRIRINGHQSHWPLNRHTRSKCQFRTADTGSD